MTINALHECSEFGYKTHHNTETMLLGLTDEALRGFDNNQATIVMFFDLSAAFDTIDPEKLLQTGMPDFSLKAEYSLFDFTKNIYVFILKF